MATTHVIQPFSIAGQPPYTSIPVKLGTLPASQTFVRGALLTRSSGRLVEAGTDPVLVLGVALHRAKDPRAGSSSVAGDPVQYIPTIWSLEFEANLMGAAAANYTLAQTDQFITYGVAKDSTTGFWFIDQSDTTNDRVFITDFVDPVGDVNARVRCIFLAAVIAPALTS